MKIIFKIGHFPLTSETFVVNHIIETIKMGYEVKILVQHRVLTMTEYDRLFARYDIHNKIILQDYDIPSRKLKRILGGCWILIKNVKEIGAILKYFEVKDKLNFSILYEWSFFKRFKDTDIFHVQYGTNSKPLDDLKKSGYFKMPLVVTFHGHDSFFPINGFIKKEGYYDHLFETAELVTVNTPYLQKQLEEIDCPPEKISTIPMPVDCTFFTPERFTPVNQEKINLLSVGRLEPIKGHRLGVLVVNKLVERGFKVIYKIVGNGSAKEDLEDLVEELGLQENVILVGALPQEEIRKFYYDADIFLMTSTVVNGDTRETQGLVSLEAQACGLPVVAFRSGGVSYTVKEGETGLLVEEGNYLEMTEAVEELIGNPHRLEGMAFKGPDFVKENFSSEKISKFWEGKYRELTIDSLIK